MYYNGISCVWYDMQMESNDGMVGINGGMQGAVEKMGNYLGARMMVVYNRHMRCQCGMVDIECF
jgi:hypothetical protein